MSDNTGLYFAQFPKNFDQLQAKLLAVSENQNEQSASSKEPCQFYREIIFTEPDLLIAPHFDESSQTFIIAERHVLTSQRLCLIMDKFSLKMVTSAPLTRNLFLYCFEFVLNHRLAPFWNKIGSYYIKGRDFLHDKGKMCAIEAVFSLTDKLIIALKAQMVTLPPFQLHNCGISPNILQKFNNSSSSVIYGHSLENNRCLVLPSLKTGYITRIAHSNNENIDFRRYWKIMYGFRVPERQSQDNVYTIRFPSSVKEFSYPECCIRSQEPVVYLRCDQKAMFQSFIQDFTSRLPSLCGTPFKITSSSFHPVKTLSSAILNNQTNLTKTMKHPKASEMFVFTASQKNTDKTLEASTNTSQRSSATVLLPKETLQEKLSGDSASDLENKPYVPNFTNRTRSGHNMKKTTMTKKSSQVERKRGAPAVPSFQKKTSGTSNTSRKRQLLVHQDKTNRSFTKSSNVVGSVDMFQDSASDSARDSAKTPSDSSEVLTKGNVTLPTRTPSSISSDHVSHGNGTKISKTPLMPTENDRVFLDFFRTGTEERAAEPHARESNNKGQLATGIVSESRFRHKTMDNMAQQLAHGQKRTHETNKNGRSDNVQVKKRTKPKQDETNIDIPKLAMTNKLSTASVSVIVKWLKAQRVPFKSKEKKTDLIAKVYTHLNLSRAEP